MSSPSWFAAIAGAILVLTLGAWLFNRSKYATGKRLKYLAVGLVACGTLLSAAVVSTFLLMIGGLISGAGFGLLWLVWSRVLVQIDSEKLEYIIPASAVVTAIISLIYPSMMGVMGAIAVALLPILSVVCLIVVQMKIPASAESVDGKTSSAAPMPIKDILFAIIYIIGTYFVIGGLDSLLPPTENAIGTLNISLPIFIGSCFGVFLAVSCILHAVRIDLSSLSKAIAPILICAIVLFALKGHIADQFSVALIVGADFMASTVAVIYFVGLEKSGKLGAYNAIGISQGAMLIGALSGNYFGGQLFEGFDPPDAKLLIIVLALALVLVVSISFVPRRLSDSVPTPTQSATEQENDLVQRILDIAASNDLTAREAEILGYLAKGRTEPYIREQLWLSRSTVSTHVKHIYQKLGIHSKQEIISLLES
jgi:DNA-binding CsgD family transcriptional regulator